ncbi:general substrate transporter [Aspergillus karnatakaensis]|uniref:general substrate transporter n=1 Tax=Aspergillus karnatakaensis TaxID=1810916 RepID=UPI003CCDD179
MVDDSIPADKHNLALLAGLRTYPKAIFWSVAMSTSIIMEGYDTMLMGNFYGQSAFRRQYGMHVEGDTYEISSSWQAGLSNASTCGQLLGLLMAGYVSERFGFRMTMIFGLGVMIGLIFIPFFAPSLAVLCVGQVFLGIPLGLFQTTPVLYATEILPVCLRAYLTVYVNVCWAFGHLIGAGILRATATMDTQWAYRIPFAIQWICPLLLIPLLFFAPESPWWLVRRGRLEEVKAVLRSVVSNTDAEIDVDKFVALMVVTTEHERSVNASTSYAACLRGIDLRRTLIGIGIYCTQTLSRNPLRSYSTYFLQQAGMPSTRSFDMTIIGYALAVAGGFVSWALLPILGRRPVYVYSLATMTLLLLLIGILGIPQATSSSPAYSNAIGALLIISSFLYNSGMGPLTNTLCSEIPSALLRSKSVVLARWTYSVSGVIAGTITPYQLDSTAWTKGRTTVEMDLLFERGVSMRRFGETEVDLVEGICGDEKRGV